MVDEPGRASTRAQWRSVNERHNGTRNHERRTSDLKHWSEPVMFTPRQRSPKIETYHKPVMNEPTPVTTPTEWELLPDEH